jgi:2,5-diketo-D-gluconate reductase A
VGIPQLGLGTARNSDQEIRRIVREALDLGYRQIDTAAKYENEVGVGQGIADAGLDRSEVFVTTKLRGSKQGS